MKNNPNTAYRLESCDLLLQLFITNSSEYSFESQTSGTSGTSDQDFRLEVEYTSDLGPTRQDMTPVPDHDIFSKVEAARNLMELSLDMDDILIDDGNFIKKCTFILFRNITARDL